MASVSVDDLLNLEPSGVRYPRRAERDAPSQGWIADSDAFTELRSPATENVRISDEEYIERINGYFTLCNSEGMIPRLSGLALALGLAGISSVPRLARRRPALTFAISRAITSIQYHYESQLEGKGARGAIFALKHLQDFDPEEGPGAPAIPAWRERLEIDVNQKIVGVISHEDRGSDLSPEMAYMRIIKGSETLVLERREKAIEGEVVAREESVVAREESTFPDEA